MLFNLKIGILNKVASAIGGCAAYYLLSDEKKALLSWTTNHSPSVTWDWNWDRREPSLLVKPDHNNNTSDCDRSSENNHCKNFKSTASRHLIFIRHGQYNLEGASDEERTLTKTGREQAALTGQRLHDLSHQYNRFVYSTMTRATETAQIILQNIDQIDNLETCALLREGAPIPPEPAVGSWKAEMHKFYTDGARIEAAFRKYFHRAPPSQTETSYELFVCHANVIRYFVCRALQLPPEAWLRMSLHNGSITYLTIRPDGRVGLKQLGDCGFMPKDKLSFN